MKVRTDEHISPEIVRAVREMSLSPGWEISSVFESGDRGAADEHWITRFARNGGRAIISADVDFFKSPPQVLAVFNTGIRVIHLPPKWANAGCHLQAAHVLLWWRRIEARISAMNDRECYRPPWNINESGELMRVQVDYAEAHKKYKKSARRAIVEVS
jgi:PIN like domain